MALLGGLPSESAFWASVHADARRERETREAQRGVLDSLGERLGIGPTRPFTPYDYGRN